MSPSSAAAPTDRWWLDPDRDPDVIDRLRAAMADALMPFDVGPGDFARRNRGPAELRRVRFGPLALVESNVPDVFSGSSRVPVGRAPERVAVTMVTKGQQFVRQGERSAVLGPGDMFVVDGEVPGTFLLQGRVRARTLVLPRTAARRLVAGLPPALTAASPHGRLLGSYLGSLARELPTMSRAAAQVAAEATAELLGLLAVGPDVTDAGPLRVALLPAVRRHVEDNLGDPDLSPAAIAAAHAISLRTLHAMFAPTGESVGAFIRRRRLERSRADLLAHPRRPITDIALRWGFASPSAFTRAFRARFDLTPSRLRADPEG